MTIDAKNELKEIENVIGVKRNFRLFEESKGKVVLNLLKYFEAFARKNELLNSGSVSNLISRINVSINWAYNNCEEQSFEVNNKIDENIFRKCQAVLNEAASYKNFYDMLSLFSLNQNNIEINKENKKINITLPKDDNILNSIAGRLIKILNSSEISHDDYEFDISENTDILSKISKSVKNNNLKLSKDKEIWDFFGKMTQAQLKKDSILPDDWEIENFKIEEFKEFWKILLIKSSIHKTATLFLGNSDLNKLIMTYSSEELYQLFLSKTNLSKTKIKNIIDFMTYDNKLNGLELNRQPFIKLTDDLYVISPTLVMDFEIEKNLIYLTRNKNVDCYNNILTYKKEEMIRSIKNKLDNKFSNLLFSFQNDLNSSLLKDLDMALYDKNTKNLFISNFSWSLPLKEISEIPFYKKELTKQTSDLEKILKYLVKNKQEVLKRLFGIDSKKEVKNIYGCVLSNEDVSSSDLNEYLSVIPEKKLLELLNKNKGNLDLLIEEIKSLDFLPEKNKDYKIRNQKINYEGYKVGMPVIDANNV